MSYQKVPESYPPPGYSQPYPPPQAPPQGPYYPPPQQQPPPGYQGYFNNGQQPYGYPPPRDGHHHHGHHHHHDDHHHYHHGHHHHHYHHEDDDCCLGFLKGWSQVLVKKEGCDRRGWLLFAAAACWMSVAAASDIHAPEARCIWFPDTTWDGKISLSI
ncbi:uncharacterized protein [Miscanthus floridulus]|uniref:uncharacterized protein n=1 Tax=Miscanthus floridulus TaxID=154761 RepID=UPI003458F8EA